ncbi:MAG: GNAT family N-acetyltransferase [Planctomycetota bacterium]|nr:MAG: GNAT family N-acetyltransferase [Planctomycetota bacterium]
MLGKRHVLPPQVRSSRLFAEDGVLFPVRQAASALKRLFRRFCYEKHEMVVCLRDNRMPVQDLPRHYAEKLRIRLAVPEDVKFFRGPVWDPLKESFASRIQDPQFHAVIGFVDGELVGMAPFYTTSYRHPRYRFVFDPGEQGIYWFEGFTVNDWRGKGIALLGMNWLFSRLESEFGKNQVLTYYDSVNLAAKRLHDRYSFVPQFLLTCRRIGPIWLSSRNEVPPHLREMRPLRGRKKREAEALKETQ